jgi:hypothetical protein
LCHNITYLPFKIKIKDVAHAYNRSSTHKEKWILCKSCADNIQYMIQKEVLNEHGRSKKPGNGNVSECKMASARSQYAGPSGVRNMADLTGEGQREQEAFLQHFIDLRVEEEKERRASSDDHMGMDVYP